MLNKNNKEKLEVSRKNLFPEIFLDEFHARNILFFNEFVYLSGHGFTPDETDLERLRHIETSLSKRSNSRLTTSNGRISGAFSDSMT